MPAKILAIDDSRMVHMVITKALRPLDVEVLTAINGQEGLEKAEKDQPDLILLDIGLPWINGYELAELMKAHADLSRVPIVFVSGQDDIPAMKRGFSVGAHDFIAKPFDVHTVRKTVRTLLELS